MAEDYREDSSDRWWAKDGDALGQAVWEIGTQLEQDDEPRREKCREFLCEYLGRNDVDLDGYGTLVDEDVDRYDLDLGMVQTLCDTVHAEIAGRQKPVPKFQTSGADWKTKRTAKKLERYCTAQLHYQQGKFLNVWELFEAAFHDSTIFGTGVAKVFVEDEKIRTERHFVWELHVDKREARYGDPQNLFHVYTMERDKAIECFCADMEGDERAEMEAAIMVAPDADRRYEPGVSGRVARTVKIVEAWRLPHGKDKPGKHVFCVEGKTLFEEEWDRPEFPFVFIRWNPDKVGFWSKGLAEEAFSIHKEINENARKMQERFILCGSNRTYYESGSIRDEDLQSNEAEVFIPYKKGTKPPVTVVAKPIAESEWMYLKDQFDFAFRRTGVSEMRAGARKEPGVTSGVGLRTINDIQTARFSLKAKAYENAFVAHSRQCMYCAKEMGEKVANRGLPKRDQVEWDEVSMPGDMFSITIAPTASLPNDPAGRMQMAQELYSNQLIGKETFKQLLGWPDLEKEMNNETSQRRWVEQQIDEMLDGESYEPPEELIADKPGAMMQVVNAYFDALYEKAPEESLAALRAWIMAIDRDIQAAEAAAAEAQAEMQLRVQKKVEAQMGQMSGGAPGAVPPQALG